MSSTTTTTRASALIHPAERNAPPSYTGVPAPTLFVPADVIRRMKDVERDALAARVTPELLDSTPGARKALDGATSALGRLRAAEREARSVKAEHYAERVSATTTQTRRDFIEDSIIRPADRAVKDAETAYVAAHRAFLTTVFSVEEEARLARQNAAIDAVPGAHRAAVEALEDLEAALRVREAGYAVAGYPAVARHLEPAPGKPRDSHWSTSSVVPYNGRPAIALDVLLRNVRTVVEAFPVDRFVEEEA